MAKCKLFDSKVAICCVFMILIGTILVLLFAFFHPHFNKHHNNSVINNNNSNNNDEYNQRIRQCEESATTVSGSHKTHQNRICRGDLIFEENFDTFNFETWKHAITLSGGGNWEFQWYCNNRSNSYVKDGFLYIKPTLTSDYIGEEKLFENLDINGFHPADYCNEPRFYGCSREGNKQIPRIVNPVRSAKLTTVNTFAFKYGKVQIRAKLPIGDWLWPGITLIPIHDAYGHWPSSGMIVLMNARGNEKLWITNQNGDDENIGAEVFQSVLRWGPTVTSDRWEKTYFQNRNKTNPYNKGFHLYELEWTPDNITFFVDHKKIGEVSPAESFWKHGEFEFTNLYNPWINGAKMAPFDQEFYLSINLAVGGIFYFPDNAKSNPRKPWSNLRQNAMTEFWENRIDWIKSWKLNEGGESAAFIIDYIKIWAV